ncbi:hypothetical protein [Pararhodobacter marinus]|uniref:hypothetical protein n=1 Tax=Pararhodobacter marinus TaxID=2184063 RepID=UPI003514C53E
MPKLGRVLALMLALISVLAAGVAHAHVDDVKAANPLSQVVVSLHDAASGGLAHANAMPSHCATTASCHTLFLVGMQTGSFEPESASVAPVPLHYSAPPVPVFGLFRPPRRG